MMARTIQQGLLLLLILALGSLTSCRTLLGSLRDDPPPAREKPSPDARPGLDSAAVREFLEGSNLSPEVKEGAEFALRTYEGFQRANGNLTALEEYYLGRAFGVQVLSRHAPVYNLQANQYLNRIGQALARTSDRPDTYSGYRFLLIDSDEPNAFAAPGGFVFVTRGLVKMTRSEPELAAVLAHEIGHIEQEHGLKAIRKDRLQAWLVGTVADGAQTFGDSRLQELTAAFEDSVADLTRTIVNNGYSRQNEFEADDAALRILNRAGYPPQALLTVLESLKKIPDRGGEGFGRTHPKAQDRIQEVRQQLGRSQNKSYQVPASQKRRFQAALGWL